MPLDANGWTQFTFTTGRYIYVSNAGSDTNDGLTVSTPYKTIGKAVSVLTDTHPDWVLLRKGDTFTIDGVVETGWGTNFAFLNGKSATEPMLFSSYETAQPGVPNPSTTTARPIIQIKSGNVGVQCTRGGSGSADNLAFVGLDFYSYQRDPNNTANYAGTSTDTGTTGMYWLQTTTYMLIEDCVFRFHEKGISINPSTTNSGTTIRRNIFVDSWSNFQSSTGLFANKYANFVIDQNLFDNNGYDTYDGTHSRNYRSRNVYLSSYGSSPATFTNNISTNSGSEGLQIRTGGTVTNNLFSQNPTGFSINGSEVTDGSSVQNSNACTISNNVIVNSNDLNQSVANGGTTNYGIGMQFLPNGGTATVTGNIIAHTISAGSFGQAMHTQRISITNCANNGAGLIRVTVQAPGHGQVTGNTVTIGAVTGTTEANGTWTVTVISGTVFDLQGSTFTHAYVSGGSMGTVGVTADNTNIIYDWKIGVDDVDSQNSFSPVVDLAGSNSEGYPNPGDNVSPRNDLVGLYNGSLGGTATLAAFITSARGQSKGNWNANITASAANNYIRTGFGSTGRRGGKSGKGLRF